MYFILFYAHKAAFSQAKNSKTLILLKMFYIFKN